MGEQNRSGRPEWSVFARSWWKPSSSVRFLAVTSALALTACTGLQGGEPHDDDSGAPIVGHVTDTGVS